MSLVLATGAGYWSPIVWLIAFVIVMAMACLIRSRGERGCKYGTEQTMPFFSGNEPPGRNIHSSNLYWGFIRMLGKYFILLRRAHSGVVNDYAYSFVLLLVVIMAALVVGGML
jgi:multicomponent Na+:H+ antiporter subunit D